MCTGARLKIVTAGGETVTVEGVHNGVNALEALRVVQSGVVQNLLYISQKGNGAGIYVLGQITGLVSTGKSQHFLTQSLGTELFGDGGL